MWHEDAVWDVGDRQFRGREEIAEAIQRQWDQLTFMAHWTANLSIDPAGSDRARGEVDVDTITQTGEGVWLHSAGTYEDRYQRRHGRWAITHRTARVHLSRQIEPPGKSNRQYPQTYG